MHPGHSKVEREEDLRLLCHIGSERFLFQAVRMGIDELRDVEMFTRNVVLLPFLMILIVFDAEKHESEKGCDDEEEDKQSLLPYLSRPHTQRHEEARANEDRCIR